MTVFSPSLPPFSWMMTSRFSLAEFVLAWAKTESNPGFTCIHHHGPRHRAERDEGDPAFEEVPPGEAVLLPRSVSHHGHKSSLR